MEIVQRKNVTLHSCRYHSVFPRGFRFVLGKIWLFSLLIWHFKASGVCFKVPCQPRRSGGFACLGSHPGLANCTGASIEAVIVARCTGCSSKLCLSFDPFQPRSLQQRRLHKHYNFGTATSYHGLKWSEVKIVIAQKQWWFCLSWKPPWSC